MSQDLDQILLLIGSVLGAGFTLLFLLARLEPKESVGLVSPVQLPDTDSAVGTMPSVSQ